VTAADSDCVGEIEGTGESEGEGEGIAERDDIGEREVVGATDIFVLGHFVIVPFPPNPDPDPGPYPLHPAVVQSRCAFTTESPIAIILRNRNILYLSREII
jgi:hypothetical protein